MAKKLYKSILKEYKRGVKTSGDVKSSDEALRDAMIRREKLKLDYIISKIELERLVNRKVKLHYYEKGH